MVIRITADIDTKKEFVLLESIFNTIKKIKKIKKIEIMPSNSKGWHIIIFTTQKYTLKEQFKLRKLINDDKNRIRLDKQRKTGRNTLFYKKKYLKKEKFTGNKFKGGLKTNGKRKPKRNAKNK